MISQEPRFTRHFSTPIIIDRLASAEGIALLKRVILERKAQDPGVTVSNIGGWHSDTQMIDWGGEVARALVHKVLQLADAYTFDVKQKDERRYDWFPEMWANVSGPGHANHYHTHPGAFWSAVAYVDDGRRESNEDVGGELTFLDPRMPMIRMTAPDLRIGASKDMIEPSELSIPVRTGMLLLFPSWLSHAVQPFRGAAERISIAINLMPAPAKRATG